MAEILANLDKLFPKDRRKEAVVRRLDSPAVRALTVAHKCTDDCRDEGMELVHARRIREGRGEFMDFWAHVSEPDVTGHVALRFGHFDGSEARDSCVLFSDDEKRWKLPEGRLFKTAPDRGLEMIARFAKLTGDQELLDLVCEDLRTHTVDGSYCAPREHCEPDGEEDVEKMKAREEQYREDRVTVAELSVQLLLDTIEE